jgi:hypothetical protein
MLVPPPAATMLVDLKFSLVLALLLFVMVSLVGLFS